MQYGELIDFLQNVGKDPSRLIFEDELTGIHNRRFLRGYLRHKVNWESLDDSPLAMLILDLDRFKEVNDSHGHDAGDQLLSWIAVLLKDIAGKDGLPVRFGGDEFILLLPDSDREKARQAADSLLQRTRDRPFKLRDADTIVPITLSIGVASAPEDAIDARGLLEASDTALYYAKQSGRDRAASASEVDPEKVFAKTALYRLEASSIAGRDKELEAVSTALTDLSRELSSLLVVEGSPGSGKSTFLETVRQSLAGDAALCVAKVTGKQLEAYRAYYLATDLLVALLNQREDKGAQLLDNLSAEEIGYLAHVLPRLADDDVEHAERADSAKRQGIFTTLVRFIPKLCDARPMVLLVDDLQFADEATLFVLRALMESDDLDLFICGASLESLHLASDEESPPAERFLARYPELDVRRLTMQPLHGRDIGVYLEQIFPNLTMPDELVPELAAVTQGSPLFLSEIIRKLIADQKVTLVGHQWEIQPIEEGYLPRSLEEIVSEKIAALDKESRELLEQATTFGEDLSLSVLTGSSEMDENRVLEFLDRAESLGLVRLGFQINDETMHFLGKQVLEISYGAIDQDRRAELHEHVGTYQEGLYEQNLLPSASLLAYHFQRSANQEKARRYEQLQFAYGQSVFNADEADDYSLEPPEEEPEWPRLDLESFRMVPNVLRSFMTSVRSIQLYPPESKAITSSLGQVHLAIDAVLEKSEGIYLSQADRVLLANGQRLDIAESGTLAYAFLKLLLVAELQGVGFRRGVTEEEIGTFLRFLGSSKDTMIKPGFWKDFILKEELRHIELVQLRYSRVQIKLKPAATSHISDEALSAEELRQLPRILRAVLGAAKNIQLYPLGSNPVSRSIDEVHASLQDILATRQALTLSGTVGALLVNGTRVSTADFDEVARNFLKLLRRTALTSLTFLTGVPKTEIETFIGALREVPKAVEPEFWEDFTTENALASIAFNQRQYALGVVHSLLGAVEAPVGDEEGGESEEVSIAERVAQEPAEALRRAIPKFGKELLVQGEKETLDQLLRRAFMNFAEQDPSVRLSVVQGCHMLFDSLILALQHRFTGTAAKLLLQVVPAEKDPSVLRELVTILHKMADSAVQFSDYEGASGTLTALRERQKALKESDGEDAERLAIILERPLSPTSQKLLEDDLKSGEPTRQEKACQVLSSVGELAIPMLIEVIRQEKDLRVQQLAAGLLREIGPESGRQMKRALATEVTVKQRSHILEVIDTVTKDLRDELAYCLGDENPKIRRLAFRLFERLQDDHLIDAVLPFAASEDAGIAKGTIRSLAYLQSAAAVSALISVLEDAEDEVIAIACCQALGQMGDPMAIDALNKVLAGKKFVFFGWKWPEQVRATAAIALCQISDVRAVETLSRYRNDKATRIRQLARSAAEHAEKTAA